MTRERLVELAETVRNVGAMAAIVAGLLLWQLVFYPSCSEVGEEPSELSAEIERTHERLAELGKELMLGELDARAFREAQYSALLDLAEVALDTPVEDMNDLELAVAYFTDDLLSGRDSLSGEFPGFLEPASLGAAWAALEDDQPDLADRLRYDFFPYMTEEYLDDMRVIGETGLFAIPGRVARELGFEDWTTWEEAAENVEGLEDAAFNRIAHVIRLLLEDHPEADARLVFWGIFSKTATPQADEILLRLKTSRGVR